MEQNNDRSLKHTKQVLDRVVYAENELQKNTSLADEISGTSSVPAVLVTLIERGAFDY